MTTNIIAALIVLVPAALLIAPFVVFLIVPEIEDYRRGRAEARAEVWNIATGNRSRVRRVYRAAARRAGKRYTRRTVAYVQSVRDAHAAAGLPAPRFAWV